MDVDDYEIHTDLVEKFIANGDKTAFKKMLNMNLNNNNNNKIEKQKENLLKKQQFMKSMRPKKPAFYYDNFNMNHLLDNAKTFKPGEINNFKLDFHNILQDPEYKDKCMKGNYKWASMRFQMMKANLAKRKGISIDEFKMPKIWSKKKNNNKQLYENFETKKNNFFKQVKTQDKTLNIKEDHKNAFHTDKINKFPKVYKGKYQPLKRLPSHKNPNTFVI